MPRRNPNPSIAEQGGTVAYLDALKDRHNGYDAHGIRTLIGKGLSDAAIGRLIDRHRVTVKGYRELLKEEGNKPPLLSGGS